MAPELLRTGDRVRLRPGDRPRLYAFGRGMEEYGEALFTRGQTDVTFAGREFAVREEGSHLVLFDDVGEEVLVHVPRRRGRGKIGELELELPGKKPGRLGKATELHLRDGIIVAELSGPVPPLPVLFACVVVVWRLELTRPKRSEPDWTPAARTDGDWAAR